MQVCVLEPLNSRYRVWLAETSVSPSADGGANQRHRLRRRGEKLLAQYLIELREDQPFRPPPEAPIKVEKGAACQPVCSMIVAARLPIKMDNADFIAPSGSAWVATVIYLSRFRPVQCIESKPNRIGPSKSAWALHS